MILLLMIATVSAATTKETFTTYVNFTKNDTTVAVFTEGGPLGPWVCNGTLTGPTSTNFLFNIYRDISYEEIGGLENVTKVMEELVKVSLQLATHGNDTRTYLERYNEKNEAWARTVENYETCKQQRDEYKNDSIQLATCQSDLTENRRLKSDSDTKFATCDQDLTDQKASTQTTGVICILVGVGIGYGFFWYKKEYVPAEKRSF